MSARRITDGERRARLVARHHLGRTAGDVETMVRGVVALHATDPATPHLSARARVPGFTTDDLDRALCTDRTLWRLHAMRRTLFIVPTAEASVFHAAAARDVAAKERRRLEQWLADVMPGDAVPGWLASVEARVLETVGGGEWRTTELAEAVPELRTQLTLGSGRWARTSPVSSRLLYVMAMEGRLVRAGSAGSWRSSQYRWAATDAWFGARRPDGRSGRPDGTPSDARTGRAELARRYLRAYGPATLTDVRWWTGWTVARTRTALRDVDAVTVELDHGDGYVLPDDVGPWEDRTAAGAGSGSRAGTGAAAAVALLPALDATPMGWKERDWHLGDHAEAVFDRNGNVGPTIWVGGRIVGGWGQRGDGRVVHRLLEDIGAAAADEVADEVEALTEWLDGVVVIPRFRTPLERDLAA